MRQYDEQYDDGNKSGQYDEQIENQMYNMDMINTETLGTTDNKSSQHINYSSIRRESYVHDIGIDTQYIKKEM